MLRSGYTQAACNCSYRLLTGIQRNRIFISVETDAREIAEEIEVKIGWPEVRKRRANIQFEYKGGAERQGTAEGIFK